VKKLFLIFIVTFVVIPFSGMALGQDNKGPRMMVEGKEFDFKEVKEGTVLEHTFKVFNRGNEPLKIISVKPG
jgi:hypothetical protein